MSLYISKRVEIVKMDTDGPLLSPTAMWIVGTWKKKIEKILIW